MDKHLKKDVFDDAFDKFVSFERYERTSESITEYISEFDIRYSRIEKLKLVMPSNILAFKLLMQANIGKEEEMIVKSGMDYTKVDTLYEQAKTSLKKFKGASCGVSEHDSASGGLSIKTEPVFWSGASGGYSRGQRWRGGRGYRGGPTRGDGRSYGGFNSWRGGSFEKSRGQSDNRGQSNSDSRRVNPSGFDGQLLRCRACGSFRHMLKDCPDSWENLQKSGVNLTEDCDVQEEEACLYTGHDRKELFVLATEAQNCAVLDSACSSTVCGRAWMGEYLDSLGEKDRKEIYSTESNRIFKFGGGTRLTSEGEYSIPACIAGKNVTIKTDVVDSDIPLLLSKNAMKAAKVKLDLENDTAEIFGREVALNCTIS